MLFILGMLVAACIAGMAFLVGYGAGIATIPREPEPQGDAFASEPLRAESIARLTPTIPDASHTYSIAAEAVLAGLHPTYTH